uniref:Core-binding factor subunit beta n=1 Tax=Cyanoderma ruficeps TaxID=181631 RepID=A0A8C3XGY3_9PASS
MRRGGGGVVNGAAVRAEFTSREEVGGEGAGWGRERAAAAAAASSSGGGCGCSACAAGGGGTGGGKGGRRRRGLTKGEASAGAGTARGGREGGREGRRAAGGGGPTTMPRVVPDQRSKFENEEFFRKLSRECEIKYTGFRDRPHEERQARFQNACRDGRSEIAFVATGTNLSLQFFPASWQGEQRQTPTREYVDFEREGGKVYLKAPMILNGVCVIWKGWIDLQRLDGMGCLEFDEERAQQEDALAQQAFEEARRRTREFEDRDRSHREEMEVRVSQLLSVTGKKTARP